MSGWSFLVHITGQSAMQIVKPVGLFTHDGSCLSLYGQRPAKSVSTSSQRVSYCVWALILTLHLVYVLDIAIFVPMQSHDYALDCE